MFLKKLLKFVFVLTVPLLVYICISFLALLFPTSSIGGKQTKEIYIYHDQMHTEIIIKISDFKDGFLKSFPTLLKNSNRGYLSFSYGDEEFMMKVPTWDKIEVGVTLTSLFLNTPALLRVAHYQNISGENIIKVKLSNSSLLKLKNSIFDEFSTKKGKFIKYKDKLNHSKLFYFKAKKDYNLFHTCNNWTSKRLIDAGIKSSYLTPFSKQVIYHLK